MGWNCHWNCRGCDRNPVVKIKRMSGWNKRTPGINRWDHWGWFVCDRGIRGVHRIREKRPLCEVFSWEILCRMSLKSLTSAGVKSGESLRVKCDAGCLGGSGFRSGKEGVSKV